MFAKSWARIALAGLTLTGLASCTADNELFVDPSERTPCDVGQLVIESFDLARPNRVDILFVVDNSPGMAEAQQALSRALPDFVERLNSSSLDYQLGVISTDIVESDQQGRLQTGLSGQSNCPGNRPTIITANTAGGPTAASCNAVLGDEGDDFEAGLEAVRYALLGPAADSGEVNDGFLRDDARLVVVIFSNEDDCSDDGSLRRQNANECEWDRGDLISLSTYVGDEGFFNRIKRNNGQPVDVVVMVGPDDGVAFERPAEPDPVCEANGDAFNGRRYIEVADGLGDRGGFYSICSRGYGHTLDQVFEEHVLPRPEQICPFLTLTQEPVSVRLSVAGQSETAVPLPEDGSGYIYLGATQTCARGALRIAPDRLTQLGDNEVLELHYCTADSIPQ